MAPRKYKLNESWLDEIDSVDKAYFLGMMFADGCNHRGRSTITLCLNDSDSYLLDYFKKMLGTDRLLSHRDVSSSTCFILNSHTLSDRLSELGCVPRKSKILQFPTRLPKEFMVDFIRGYFDGDGCFTYWVGKRGSTPLIRAVWNVTSSGDFCEGLQKFILGEVGVKLSNVHSSGCRVVETSSHTSIERLYSWIYYKPELVCLTRKRDKMMDYLSLMKDEGRQMGLLGKVQDGRRAIPTNEISHLIYRYEQGESTLVLAKHYGVCHSTIANCINSNGSSTRPMASRVKLKPSDYFSVVFYYEEGMTIKEIASRFNVSSVTIQRCLKRCNVKTRPQGTKSFYGGNISDGRSNL